MIELRLMKDWRSTFQLDLRSLALMRICTGFYVFIDAIYRFLTYDLFYKESGLMPQELLEAYRYHLDWSVYLWSTDDRWALALMILQLFVGVALMLGMLTRFMVLLSFILIVSAHARGSVCDSAASLYSKVALLWCIFLPLDYAFVAKPFRRKRRGPPRLTRMHFIATIAFVLQVTAEYFGPFICKLNETWLKYGTAVLRVMNESKTTTVLVDPFLDSLAVGAFFNYGSLVVEGAAIFFLLPQRFKYLRTLPFVGLVGMHVTFMALLTVGTFTVVGVMRLFAFCPSYVWDYLGVEDPMTRAETLAPTERDAPSRVWLDRGLAFVVLILLCLNVNKVLARELKLYKSPRTVNRVSNALHFHTKFDMFDSPGWTDDWTEVRVELKDGRVLDGFHYIQLLEKRDMPVVERSTIRDYIRHYRWRRYMNNLRKKGDKGDAARKGAASYICRHMTDENILEVVVQEKSRLTHPAKNNRIKNRKEHRFGCTNLKQRIVKPKD